MKNEKMNYRLARCCGNCFFNHCPENLAGFCRVDLQPIENLNTCDLFAFTEDFVTEQQWKKINEISKEEFSKEKTHETIRDNTRD